jgi:transketolase
MARIAEVTARDPALARKADILAHPAVSSRRMADAIRALTIDAVEAAQSECPVLPMMMAEAATVLWTRFLKFDAADPRWLDRDRFVLSAEHGSMLLYALLHLTGHAGMEPEDLQRFRQLHSPATGHPEYGAHPAVEATTGPLGQGIAMAVGMTLGERMLAARFGRSLVDHRTWVIASDNDLAEGISHEAMSLAGHLRLEKLTVLYHDTQVLDGDTASGSPDGPLRHFAAHGWAVKRVDGDDAPQMIAGISFALRSKKPTLIACHTTPDFEALGKADALTQYGAPLNRTAAERAREAMGWKTPAFAVPDRVRERWRAAGSRGAGARRAWLKRLARHPLRTEFERTMAGRLPDGWHEGVVRLKSEFAETRPSLATGEASHKTLAAIVTAVPEVVGGSADPMGSDCALVKAMGTVTPGGYSGRHIQFGAREHAMAAATNGMALHGGLLPYNAMRLASSDYMRPAMRLGALMGQRLVHVLMDDSIGLGEDGPAHQPIEQLATLRAIPGLYVFRPADPVETAECWELAIRRTEGPSVLVLTRQPLPTLRTDTAENRCARGGYVLAEAEGRRRATLLATGSEVSLALRARELLHREGIGAAVVSLPSWKLFSVQDEAYRAEVLGGAPRVGIEAACGFGWEQWIGQDGAFIGMTGFGASGPYQELYRHFGITPETVASAVRKRLG